MAKRGLHFKAAGPAKRQRQRQHTPNSTSAPAKLSLEGSLSEELLLRCLSFLDAHDLVSVSRVSSGWHRLAQDGQLWRPLYLSTFASAAQRSASLSGSGPTPPRHRPWKELYKISANWRRGSAKSTSLIGSAVRRAVLPEAPPDDPVDPPDEDDSAGLSLPSRPILRPPRPPPPSSTAPLPARVDEQSDLLLQFKGCYFLTASRRAAAGEVDRTTVPAVSLLQTLPGGGSVTLGSIRSAALVDYWQGRPSPAGGLAVTELRLDEAVLHLRTDDDDDATPSPITVRLAVFLSTGQWSIFNLSLSTTSYPFTSTELYTNLALSTTELPFGSLRPPPSLPHAPPPPAFDSVTLARFHGPLLVTCSQGFVVRFWHITHQEEGSVKVTEAEPAMQTHECHLPVVLSLQPAEEAVADRERGWNKAANGPRRFRVSVAYATPVYPAAWTVALQEFDIQLPPPIEAHKQSTSATPQRVKVTAQHVAARAPPGSDHSLITAVEFAAPFLVASRNNNTIDVFELVRNGDAEGAVAEAPAAADPAAGRGKGKGKGKQPVDKTISSRRFVRCSGSSLVDNPIGPTPMSSRPREPLITQTHPPPRSHADHSQHQRPFAPLPKRAHAHHPPLSLTHRRTLFGHTGSVRTVALSGGKCVSGGADGQVKVWDLNGLARGGRSGFRRREEGVVTVTHDGEEDSDGEGGGEVGGWEFAKGLAAGGDGGEERRPGRVERVWFDEEQIVSVVEGEGVRLLRFD